MGRADTDDPKAGWTWAVVATRAPFQIVKAIQMQSVPWSNIATWEKVALHASLCGEAMPAGKGARERRRANRLGLQAEWKSSVSTESPSTGRSGPPDVDDACMASPTRPDSSRQDEAKRTKSELSDNCERWRHQAGQSADMEREEASRRLLEKLPAEATSRSPDAIESDCVVEDGRADSPPLPLPTFTLHQKYAGAYDTEQQAPATTTGQEAQSIRNVHDAALQHRKNNRTPEISFSKRKGPEQRAKEAMESKPNREENAAERDEAAGKIMCDENVKLTTIGPHDLPSPEDIEREFLRSTPRDGGLVKSDAAGGEVATVKADSLLVGSLNLLTAERKLSRVEEENVRREFAKLEETTARLIEKDAAGTLSSSSVCSSSGSSPREMMVNHAAFDQAHAVANTLHLTQEKVDAQAEPVSTVTEGSVAAQDKEVVRLGILSSKSEISVDTMLERQIEAAADAGRQIAAIVTAEKRQQIVCAAVSASPCELPRLLPPPSESAGPVAAALAVAAAASALSSSRLATPPLAHSPRQQVLVAAAWRLAREAEAERREEIELDARRLADEVSASKRRQEQAAAAVEAAFSSEAAACSKIKTQALSSPHPLEVEDSGSLEPNLSSSDASVVREALSEACAMSGDNEQTLVLKEKHPPEINQDGRACAEKRSHRQQNERSLGVEAQIEKQGMVRDDCKAARVEAEAGGECTRAGLNEDRGKLVELPKIQDQVQAAKSQDLKQKRAQLLKFQAMAAAFQRGKDPADDADDGLSLPGCDNTEAHSPVVRNSVSEVTEELASHKCQPAVFVPGKFDEDWTALRNASAWQERADSRMCNWSHGVSLDLSMTLGSVPQTPMSPSVYGWSEVKSPRTPSQTQYLLSQDQPLWVSSVGFSPPAKLSAAPKIHATGIVLEHEASDESASLWNVPSREESSRDQAAHKSSAIASTVSHHCIEQKGGELSSSSLALSPKQNSREGSQTLLISPLSQTTVAEVLCENKTDFEAEKAVVQGWTEHSHRLGENCTRDRCNHANEMLEVGESGFPPRKKLSKRLEVNNLKEDQIETFLKSCRATTHLSIPVFATRLAEQAAQFCSRSNSIPASPDTHDKANFNLAPEKDADLAGEIIEDLQKYNDKLRVELQQILVDADRMLVAAARAENRQAGHLLDQMRLRVSSSMVYTPKKRLVQGENKDTDLFSRSQMNLHLERLCKNVCRRNLRNRCWRVLMAWHRTALRECLARSNANVKVSSRSVYPERKERQDDGENVLASDEDTCSDDGSGNDLVTGQEFPRTVFSSRSSWHAASSPNNCLPDPLARFPESGTHKVNNEPVISNESMYRDEDPVDILPCLMTPWPMPVQQHEEVGSVRVRTWLPTETAADSDTKSNVQEEKSEIAHTKASRVWLMCDSANCASDHADDMQQAGGSLQREEDDAASRISRVLILKKMTAGTMTSRPFAQSLRTARVTKYEPMSPKNSAIISEDTVWEEESDSMASDACSDITDTSVDFFSDSSGWDEEGKDKKGPEDENRQSIGIKMRFSSPEGDRPVTAIPKITKNSAAPSNTSMQHVNAVSKLAPLVRMQESGDDELAGHASMMLTVKKSQSKNDKGEFDGFVPESLRVMLCTGPQVTHPIATEGQSESMTNTPLRDKLDLAQLSSRLQLSSSSATLAPEAQSLREIERITNASRETQTPAMKHNDPKNQGIEALNTTPNTELKEGDMGSRIKSKHQEKERHLQSEERYRLRIKNKQDKSWVPWHLPGDTQKCDYQQEPETFLRCETGFSRRIGPVNDSRPAKSDIEIAVAATAETLEFSCVPLPLGEGQGDAAHCRNSPSPIGKETLKAAARRCEALEEARSARLEAAKRRSEAKRTTNARGKSAVNLVIESTGGNLGMGAIPNRSFM